MLRRCSSCLLVSLVSLMWFAEQSSPAYGEVVAKTTLGGVAIQIDGNPFTEYLVRSGVKPILWPILGPTGKAMTRVYPMGELAGEKKDHIHQRSLWFTHGDVNGVNFWAENPKEANIVHRRFSTIKSGDEAILVAEDDWLGPGNKKILADERRLKFGGNQGVRWIDFDITLKAAFGPVKFGDTKEGTFGVRVAESMKVDAKPAGRIINSEGQKDQNAWGRKASWVDYHGPVGGEMLGIAILNHPSSFRFPTTWHVRTYGLFAANPFGRKEFPDGDKKDGSYTLPQGQSITLRYRVWLHRGDEKEGRVAEAWEAYSRLP